MWQNKICSQIYKFFYAGLFIFMAMGQIHCQHLSKTFDKKKSPKIGFVISPGGARALSAIGVLKVFQEHGIPIHHIVGIGWGAWIAALYSKDQSLTEVRWSLYKLSKSGFFETSLLKKILKPKKISSLQESIEENFSGLENTKIPFSCPTLTSTHKKIWKTQAFLKNAVQSCIGLPPFFKTKNQAQASPLSIKDSIKYLKDQKMDLVIWVNALEEGSLFPKDNSLYGLELFWNEMAYIFQNIEDTPTVLKISPSLNLFSMADFSKIDSIIASGEKAGYIFIKKLYSKHPSLTKNLSK